MQVIESVRRALDQTQAWLLRRRRLRITHHSTSVMAEAVLAMTVLVFSMIVTPMDLAMTVAIDPIAILESIRTMISTRAAG
jgi:hypothetical protein